MGLSVSSAQSRVSTSWRKSLAQSPVNNCWNFTFGNAHVWMCMCDLLCECLLCIRRKYVKHLPLLHKHKVCFLFTLSFHLLLMFLLSQFRIPYILNNTLSLTQTFLHFRLKLIHFFMCPFSSWRTVGLSPVQVILSLTVLEGQWTILFPQ